MNYYWYEKFQGFVDIRQTTTTTESLSLINMFRYYRDMQPMWSHMLTPLTDVASGPKGRKIGCDYEMKVTFLDLKQMVYDETLQNYTDWTIMWTVYTYYFDRQLGDVVRQNNKHIELFVLENQANHNISTPWNIRNFYW